MIDESSPQNSYDRFRSVDKVAAKIFEAMPEIAGEGSEAGSPIGSVDPGNVVPLFAPAGRDPETFFAKTERLVNAMMDALDERSRAAVLEQSRKKQHPTETDISFREARRRSQLPDGVELLQGKPVENDDAQLMAAIRGMMEDQEKEQRAVAIEKKREESRKALPSLEPQAPLTPERPKALQHQTRRRSLLNRFRAVCRRAFRKDFFLACALSIWTALALMVFIDPAISDKLFLTSLFLLFVASCLFPDAEERL